jgi:hypothetical protein
LCWTLNHQNTQKWAKGTFPFQGGKRPDAGHENFGRRMKNEEVVGAIQSYFFPNICFGVDIQLPHVPLLKPQSD